MAKCEFSGKIVRNFEIIELNSGMRVAIQLTKVCETCKRVGKEIYRHLESNVKKNALNSSEYLCTEHQRKCCVSKKIVSDKEVVLLNSNQYALKKYTAICKSCANQTKNSKTKYSYYLKSNMSRYQKHKIYACKKHSFYCWVCQEEKPILGSVENDNHIKVCGECGKKYFKGKIPKFCIVHAISGNYYLNTKIARISCPIVYNF